MLFTVIQSPEGSQQRVTERFFGPEGGSIGRSAENVWTLDDPQRYLSSTHAQVIVEHGQYYLIDLSTNGTLHNERAMERGERVALEDGDQIRMGDFILQVSLPSETELDDGPFHKPRERKPEDTTENREEPLPERKPVDIEGFIDKPLVDTGDVGGGYFNIDEFIKGTLGKENDPTNPGAGIDGFPGGTGQGVIPEFDPNELLRPQYGDVGSRPVETPQGGEGEPQARPRGTPVEPVPQPTSGGGTGHDDLLIKALGLDQFDLASVDTATLYQAVADFVLQATTGLLALLRSRSHIRSELRLDMTTIQPRENNPLKFSPTLEDALERMFVKTGGAYLKPAESVSEGLGDVINHQVAVLFGVRAAYQAMFEMLDPQALHAQFEKHLGGSLVLGSKKARYWELFEQYYEDMRKDPEKTYQRLFGDEFAQAYSRKLAELAQLSAQKKRGA